MEIQLILHHPFDKFWGERNVSFTFPGMNKASAQELLDYLLTAFPHFSEEILRNKYHDENGLRAQVAVNGKLLRSGSLSEEFINDGDTVALFQMFAGG